jgi:hypothetical protein
VHRVRRPAEAHHVLRKLTQATASAPMMR